MESVAVIFLLAPPPPTIPAFPTWKNQNLHSVAEGKAAGEGAAREAERAATAATPSCSLSSWQSNRPRPNSRLENTAAQDILTEKSQGRSKLSPGRNTSPRERTRVLDGIQRWLSSWGGGKRMKTRKKGEKRTWKRYETPTDGSAGTLISHMLAGFQNEWNLSS